MRTLIIFFKFRHPQLFFNLDYHTLLVGTSLVFSLVLQAGLLPYEYWCACNWRIWGWIHLFLGFSRCICCLQVSSSFLCRKSLFLHLLGLCDLVHPSLSLSLSVIFYVYDKVFRIKKAAYSFRSFHSRPLIWALIMF